MKAFAERTGVNPGLVRFMFDGERLNSDDKPLDKDIQDGDTIEVYSNQTGGSA